jgi:hypothetical protein
MPLVWPQDMYIRVLWDILCLFPTILSTASMCLSVGQQAKAYLKYHPVSSTHVPRYLPLPSHGSEVAGVQPVPSSGELPSTESLKDCVARTLPFW